MTEDPGDDSASWWVCCYQCEPDEAAKSRGAPGQVLPFRHPDGERATAELAVEWMGGHGDETGHREIVLVSLHGLPPGGPMPRPRHGVVLFGDGEPGKKFVVRGRAMRVTPVNAEGQPISDPVHIGENGSLYVSNLAGSVPPLSRKALPGNNNENG